MANIVFSPKQFGSVSEWNRSDILRKTDPVALYISRYQNPGDVFRSILQFDLGLLPGDQEYRISYLQLYIYRNQIINGAIRVNIHPVIEPWNQYSLNWDSQPHFADPLQTIVIPAGWKGFILFDISIIVRNWLEGSMENHGIIMTGDELHDNMLAFASSACPERDKHPQLILIPEESKPDYGLA